MFAFFLCKNVKKKNKCPCVTYISIHTDTHAYTRSCRPHSLLCCCTRAPELTVSTVTAPHPQHTLNTRTPKVHTGAFSHQASVLFSIKALPQIFALSISISDIHRLQYVLFWLFSCWHGVLLLASKLRWESYTKLYFFKSSYPFLWGSKHFWSIIIFVYHR